jgi:hypothetical protein
VNHVNDNGYRFCEDKRKFARSILFLSAIMAAVGITLLGGTHLGFAMFIGGTILAYESYLLLRKYRKD